MCKDEINQCRGRDVTHCHSWHWRRIVSLLVLTAFLSNSLVSPIFASYKPVDNQTKRLYKENKENRANKKRRKDRLDKTNNNASKNNKIDKTNRARDAKESDYVGNEAGANSDDPEDIGNRTSQSDSRKTNNVRSSRSQRIPKNPKTRPYFSRPQKDTSSYKYFPLKNSRSKDTKGNLFSSSKYQPYFELGGIKYFNQTSSVAGIYDLFIPLLQTDDKLLFTDLRIFDRSGSSFEGNAHLGFRRLFPDKKRMLGFYGSFDRKRTNRKNWFNQVMVGAEFWQDRFFIGVNAYKPIGKARRLIGEEKRTEYETSTLEEQTSRSIPIFKVMKISESTYTTQYYDHPLPGLDAELGYSFTDNLTGFAGGYYFHEKDANTVAGPKARLTYSYNQPHGRILGVLDGISIEVGAQHDKPRGASAYIGIKLKVGLTNLDKNSNLFGFERHMTELVRRDPDIITVKVKESKKTKRTFYQTGPKGFQGWNSDEGDPPSGGDSSNGNDNSSGGDGKDKDKDKNKSSGNKGSGSRNKRKGSNYKRSTYNYSKKSLLKEFGLPKDASWEDVKKRYRECMKKYHPDRHQDKVGTPLYKQYNDITAKYHDIYVKLKSRMYSRKNRNKSYNSKNNNNGNNKNNSNGHNNRNNYSSNKNNKNKGSRSNKNSSNWDGGGGFKTYSQEKSQDFKNAGEDEKSKKSQKPYPSFSSFCQASSQEICNRRIAADLYCSSNGFDDNDINSHYAQHAHSQAKIKVTSKIESKKRLKTQTPITIRESKSITVHQPELLSIKFEAPAAVNSTFPIIQSKQVPQNESMGWKDRSKIKPDVEFTYPENDNNVFSVNSYLIKPVPLDVDYNPNPDVDIVAVKSNETSRWPGEFYQKENQEEKSKFQVKDKNGTKEDSSENMSANKPGKGDYYLLDTLDTIEKLPEKFSPSTKTASKKASKGKVSGFVKALVVAPIKMVVYAVNQIFDMLVPIVGANAQSTDNEKTKKNKKAGKSKREKNKKNSKDTRKNGRNEKNEKTGKALDSSAQVSEDEDIATKKYIDIASSLEEELLAADSSMDISEIEKDAKYLFDKNGKLPLGLINAIFDFYVDNHDYFTDLIIDILAEIKNLPIATLEKLIQIISSIEDKRAAAFIALRLVEQQVILPKNVLRYLLKFLSSDDEVLYIRAIEIFRRVVKKKLPKMSKSLKLPLISLAIRLMPKVGSSQYKKLNEILDSFKLSESQKLRRNAQEQVVSWHRNPGIEEKKYISGELRDKISSSTADNLIVFYKTTLLSQHYELCEITMAAFEDLSKHEEIFWDREELKLKRLCDSWDGSQKKCLFDDLMGGIPCLAVKGGGFLLTAKQRKNLKRVFKDRPWLEEMLSKIGFVDFREIDKLTALIIKNDLSREEIRKALDRYAWDLTAYNVYLGLLLNLIDNIQEDKKVHLDNDNALALKSSVNRLVNSIEWPPEILFALLTTIGNAGILGVIPVLDLLNDYKIDIETFNRNGLNALEILTGDMPSKDLASQLKEIDKRSSAEDILSYLLHLLNLTSGYEEINRLIRDNHFFINKDTAVLLKEMKSSNDGNSEILELISSGYFRKQLRKIEKTRRDLMSFKYKIVISGGGGKPKDYQQDTIYVYKRILEDTKTAKEKRKICFATSEKNVCLDESGLKKKELAFWKSVLEGDEEIDARAEVCRQAVRSRLIPKKDNGCLTLSHWDEKEFKKWRKTIKDVDDGNIAEIITILSQAVYNTILQKKAYPRTAQILALLSLLKSYDGGLAQIATGEGKSLIIAMFAAIQVLDRRKVDVVTSSQILAIRDAEDEDYQNFYGLFGITADHNIDIRAGVKECYARDIVYGDLTHFIGDVLRDITRNIKMGRGFDLVIVDEVDNMFVDEINMLVQLAWPMPGFEFLNQIFVYMWGTAKTNALLLEPKDDQCYVKLSIDAYKDLGKLVEDIDLEDLEDKEQKTKLFKIADDCGLYLYEFMTDYTNNTILSLDRSREFRNVVIPLHLEGFAKRQLPKWIDSLFQSYIYKNKGQYVNHLNIDGLTAQNVTIIAPVDYKNTGVIQTNMHWSDGFHQFLQIKHGITIQPESVISIFMSYVEFFNRYKGSIYGVTGTLGAVAHHNFLRNVYGIKTSVIPTFAPKDFTEFKSIIVKDNVSWYQEIALVILRKIRNKRAGLVIFELMDDVERLHALLVKIGYPKSQIFTYGIGDSNEGVILSDGFKLKPGDIVIATNMAGRGTDLKVDQDVIRNGGLHVLMTIFSKSLRVEKQAFGRAARKGEPGSAQFIILIDKDSVCDDASCLRENRDIKEAQFLKNSRLVSLKTVEIRDRLFSSYVEFMREVASSTGYKILIGIPYSTAPNQNCLYLYANNEHIFLTAVNKNSSKNIDITKTLNLLDYNMGRRINNVLSRPGATSADLNKHDYEAMLFIAAEHGYVENSAFYEAVQSDFAKLSAGVFSEKDYKRLAHFAQTSVGEKYVKALATFGSTKKKFFLWMINNEQYGNKEEIKQLDEDWGIWLKKQSDIFSELRLLDNKKLTPEQLEEKRYELKSKLYVEFVKFKKQEFLSYKQGNLIRNPAYFVSKANRYFNLRYFYEKEPHFGRTINEAIGFIRKTLARVY